MTEPASEIREKGYGNGRIECGGGAEQMVEKHGNEEEEFFFFFLFLKTYHDTVRGSRRYFHVFIVKRSIRKGRYHFLK